MMRQLFVNRLQACSVAAHLNAHRFRPVLLPARVSRSDSNPTRALLDAGRMTRTRVTASEERFKSLPCSSVSHQAVDDDDDCGRSLDLYHVRRWHFLLDCYVDLVATKAV